MKTEFRIIADTEKMTVHLKAYQGGKHKATWRYATVTDAARALLDKIATVMEPKKPKTKRVTVDGIFNNPKGWMNP